MKFLGLILVSLFSFLGSFFSFSQTQIIERIAPTQWWVGMKNPSLQLMVYGKNIAQNKVVIQYTGVRLAKINKVENPNYLFLDIVINPFTKAGKVPIIFLKGKNKTILNFELLVRTKKPKEISQKDLVYLVMPDRFSNGDPGNDAFPDMADTICDRKNPWARHGGDLQGIINHLDYFSDIGITTLWLNPVTENNQPQTDEGGTMRSAYHGYGFTDHYTVDKRLGGNAIYLKLIQLAHQKNIKIIQDLVYNHVGINHWMLKDLPMKNWLNQWENYTNTSYRDEPVIDFLHGNQHDFNVMQKGWFVPFLPDLNSKNTWVQNYLIQNTLWLIEYFGVDGFRVDTYMYNDLEFMNKCNKAILQEYPTFFITGENSVQNPISQAFFVENNLTVPIKSNLPSANDFVLYNAINQAFKEDFSWGKGLNKLYTVLATDMIYKNPNRNMTFLDNHDEDRFFSVIGESVPKLKMALGFLLTTRGIPQIYYGTENLTKNFKNPSDAEVRKDFVGGWKEDKQSKFKKEELTDAERDFFTFFVTLAQVRKSNLALNSGKLTQFLPQDGVYVYFRYTGNECFMIILNQNKERKTINTKKYEEIISTYTSATELMSNKMISTISDLTIEPMSFNLYKLK